MLGDLTEESLNFRPYGLYMAFTRGIDSNCNILQWTVQLVVSGGRHTLAAGDLSYAPRVDQEDTIACYLATGVPLGTAVWSLFGDAITHGKRVEYWTFTVAPPVRYDFTGFFSPVENLPVVNRARAGQAVPVTFSLNGDQGLNIFAAEYPRSQQTTCDSGAEVGEMVSTATAGKSTLQYDASTGQYTYVWKTDKNWRGTCRQLTLRFADGSVQMLKFQVQ